MEKYKVSIQNQEITVWSTSHKSAFKKAIKRDTGIPFVFAVLSKVLKDGDNEDEELLFHIDYLKNNGYFDGLKLNKFD
jgi:hypothetical protein